MTQTRTRIKLNPSELFAWTCHNILDGLQNICHIKDEPPINTEIKINEDDIEIIQENWVNLELNRTNVIIEAVVPETNDPYGVYGAKFESHDQIIYVMAPSVDDDKITPLSLGAFPLPIVLNKVKSLQQKESKNNHNKPVTFHIPNSQCHNFFNLDATLKLIGHEYFAIRQHWTLITIYQNKYEFYDPKSFGFNIYPLSYLRFYLKENGFEEACASCLLWQDDGDKDYCGYFIGEAAKRRTNGILNTAGVDKPKSIQLKEKFDFHFNFEKQLPKIPNELKPILFNNIIAAVRRNEYYMLMQKNKKNILFINDDNKNLIILNSLNILFEKNNFIKNLLIDELSQLIFGTLFFLKHIHLNIDLADTIYISREYEKLCNKIVPNLSEKIPASSNAALIIISGFIFESSIIHLIQLLKSPSKNSVLYRQANLEKLTGNAVTATVMLNSTFFSHSIFKPKRTNLRQLEYISANDIPKMTDNSHTAFIHSS